MYIYLFIYGCVFMYLFMRLCLEQRAAAAVATKQQLNFYGTQF